jgi:hypothetical protein
VLVTGVYNKPMFSPAATVTMKDGKAYSGDYPYARMCWNFDQLVERLHDMEAKFPLGKAGLDALIDACRKADTLAGIGDLHALTRPK